MDKITLSYEGKIIRNMLLYIFSESKKKNQRMIALTDIENKLSKHKNSVFSWCEWCCSAKVLEGNGTSFGIRRNLITMSYQEFYQYIYSRYI